MATGNWTLYNDAKERIAKAEIDLNGDTFKAVLLTSSYTPAGTHSVLADLTNEVTGGNYARVTLTTVTVSETSGTVTFDSDDIDFGSNTTITAKYCVIYDDTHASDALLCYIDLNSGGGSVSSSAGTFKVTINASGIFTMA